MKYEIRIIIVYFVLEIEMPSLRPLMLMEMNGFGLNSVELDRMKKVLDFKAALLELRAYQLAGRQFSLSSPKDIRQVNFVWLKH